MNFNHSLWEQILYYGVAILYRYSLRCVYIPPGKQLSSKRELRKNSQEDFFLLHFREKRPWKNILYTLTKSVELFTTVCEQNNILLTVFFHVSLTNWQNCQFLIVHILWSRNKAIIFIFSKHGGILTVTTDFIWNKLTTPFFQDFTDSSGDRGVAGGGARAPSQKHCPLVPPQMKWHFAQGSMESRHFESLATPLSGD